MAALALGTTDLIDRRLALLTCHAGPRSGLRQKCILSVYHPPFSLTKLSALTLTLRHTHRQKVRPRDRQVSSHDVAL